MPKFMLIRIDPDASMLKLADYTLKKGMLLKVKRGHTKMVSLDTNIKYLKTQMTQFLQLNPQADFGDVLGRTLESYNAKYNPWIGGTPAEMNSDFNGDAVFSTA